MNDLRFAHGTTSPVQAVSSNSSAAGRRNLSPAMDRTSAQTVLADRIALYTVWDGHLSHSSKNIPPGSYTLEVWYQLAWASGGGPPRFMGRLSFDIAHRGVTVETPVPVLSILSKLLLVLACLAIAAAYMRRRAAR